MVTRWRLATSAFEEPADCDAERIFPRVDSRFTPSSHARHEAGIRFGTRDQELRFRVPDETDGHTSCARPRHILVLFYFEDDDDQGIERQ
jgi:hypothetical protein